MLLQINPTSNVLAIVAHPLRSRLQSDRATIPAPGDSTSTIGCTPSWRQHESTSPSQTDRCTPLGLGPSPWWVGWIRHSYGRRIAVSRAEKTGRHTTTYQSVSNIATYIAPIAKIIWNHEYYRYMSVQLCIETKTGDNEHCTAFLTARRLLLLRLLRRHRRRLPPHPGPTRG